MTTARACIPNHSPSRILLPHPCDGRAELPPQLRYVIELAYTHNTASHFKQSRSIWYKSPCAILLYTDSAHPYIKAIGVCNAQSTQTVPVALRSRASQANPQVAFRYK
jgi:hypothetical protein